MSSSDDDFRIPEEDIPPVDSTRGSKIIAGIKEAVADPVRRAQFGKDKAEAAEAAAAAVGNADMLAIQQTDLTCIQCRLDGTVPFQVQDSAYTHSQLNRHLKSNYHTRRMQVRRAFDIDKNEKGQCKCPYCPEDDETMYLQNAFLAHMDSEHAASIDF